MPRVGTRTSETTSNKPIQSCYLQEGQGTKKIPLVSSNSKEKELDWLLLLSHGERKSPSPGRIACTSWTPTCFLTHSYAPSPETIHGERLDVQLENSHRIGGAEALRLGVPSGSASYKLRTLLRTFTIRRGSARIHCRREWRAGIGREGRESRTGGDVKSKTKWGRERE
jgi:hypothetical protein